MDLALGFRACQGGLESGLGGLWGFEALAQLGSVFFSFFVLGGGVLRSLSFGITGWV